MSWSRRYASEIIQPWTEDNMSTIEHIINHHKDLLKNMTPDQFRQAAMAKAIIEGNHFFPAVHELAHGGRPDGPDRGIDFIDINPEGMSRVRNNMTHGHLDEKFEVPNDLSGIGE